MDLVNKIDLRSEIGNTKTISQITDNIISIYGTAKISTEDEKKSFRSFFFTINNFTTNDENNFRNMKYSYIVYQIEKGENKETEHLQGLIWHKNQIKWSTLKRRFPTAHIELTKIIPKAITYCKKDKTRVRGPYEIGKEPKQGKRTDLEDACEDFLQDKDRFLALHKNFIVKYPGGFDKLESMTFKPRTNRPMYIEEDIMEEEIDGFFSGIDNYFIYDEDNKWNGYKQQLTVVLLTEKGINMKILKSMAKMNVNVKYNSIPFNSPRIIRLRILEVTGHGRGLDVDN